MALRHPLPKKLQKTAWQSRYCPDKYHIAIFCDSDFWHGYQWDAKKCKIKANRDYWIKKIEDNIQRDRDYDEQLIEMGWLPLHFWEHQINKDLEGCIDEILSNLPDHVQ